jgi:hypothetical protein
VFTPQVQARTPLARQGCPGDRRVYRVAVVTASRESEASMIEVVELDRLKEAVGERGTSAYVLTVSGTATPHVVQAAVRWVEGRLAAEVGATTARNATARPGVSVLYPARSPVDHSLIIDGTARIESVERRHRLLVTPTRGVLHRDAPSPDPTSSCTADCVPLLQTVRPATR